MKLRNTFRNNRGYAFLNLVYTGISVLMFAHCSKREVATALPVKQQLLTSVDSNVVVPPAWAFGVLYGGYTNQKETIEVVESIIEHNYPIDGYWIDSWFWSYEDQGRGPHKFIDFVADTVAYPDREAMWSFLQSRGIKGGFWIWDCIQQTGNESAFKEFEEKGFFSSVYLNTNPWHNKGTSTAMYQASKVQGTLCGNIDFNNPAAANFFKQKIRHFFEEGADFIKLDRTTDISTCKAMFEATREFGRETKGRGFILSHSGGTEDPSYKRYPAKWTDDTRADWTVESPTKDFNAWVPAVAFKENIAMFTDTSLATSKIPFLTNDTGGFDMGKTDSLDEELYLRWVQFSMFNPITEVFAQPENRTRNFAFNYSAKADSIFRYYAQLRMQLFPYFYSYALKTRLTGEPMIRPAQAKYQFTVGEEMLLAPVYQKGATDWMVTLPEGEWFDYWTGAVYEKGQIEVPSPVENIPLLIKSGAMVPMRRYARSIEKGSNDFIVLHIYLTRNSKTASFTLIEDDGVSNDYLENIFAVTPLSIEKSDDVFYLRIGPTDGSYKGMINAREWQFVIHSPAAGCSVAIDGERQVMQREKDTFYTRRIGFNKNVQGTVTIELK